MKLTSENYFSLEMQMKFMGVSQFKAFEECQAAALAEISGNYEREKTTSLLVGSYVDAYFEGTLDTLLDLLLVDLLKLEAKGDVVEDIVVRE